MRLAAVTTCKAAIDVTEPPGKEGGVAWEGRGGGGGGLEHDVMYMHMDVLGGRGGGG